MGYAHVTPPMDRPSKAEGPSLAPCSQCSLQVSHGWSAACPEGHRQSGGSFPVQRVIPSHQGNPQVRGANLAHCSLAGFLAWKAGAHTSGGKKKRASLHNNGFHCFPASVPFSTSSRVSFPQFNDQYLFISINTKQYRLSPPTTRGLLVRPPELRYCKL